MASTPARAPAAPAPVAAPSSASASRPSGPGWRTNAAPGVAVPISPVTTPAPPAPLPPPIGVPATPPAANVVISGADPREDPLVKDIIELFHAKVVHVEKKPE